VSQWLDLPETNVLIFALLLNFVWEFAQVPLFASMSTADHWAAIAVCARATLGDALIALIAFWAAAITGGSRRWILEPRRSQLITYLAVGIAITIVMEWLATRVLDRWAYAPSMPIIPLLGVGLSPIIQWLIVPLLLVWFVRRQLT
jgi:hypothetical protein